jgi:hypothetical protein
LVSAEFVPGSGHKGRFTLHFLPPRPLDPIGLDSDVRDTCICEEDEKVDRPLWNFSSIGGTSCFTLAIIPLVEVVMLGIVDSD